MGRYEWAAGIVTGRVIDAACGCGYGSHYLAEKAGVEVDAIDCNPDAIAYAMKHWSHQNVIYMMQALPDVVFAKADWVVCFETLEHLAMPGRSLRRFASDAKNLLVSVPNENKIPFDAGRFPFHMKHYTPEQFKALLEANGWAVKEMLTQAAANTRIPASGDDGRTLVAVCERG